MRNMNYCQGQRISPNKAKKYGKVNLDITKIEKINMEDLAIIIPGYFFLYPVHYCYYQTNGQRKLQNSRETWKL